MKHLGKWRVLLLIVPISVICLALWADTDDDLRSTVGDADDSQLILKLYPIGDLLVGARLRDYPYAKSYRVERSCVTYEWEIASRTPDFFGDAAVNNFTNEELIDNIIETIRESVDPYSWDGDAAIRVLGFTLYISQTPELHEEIAHLLAEMRKDLVSWESILVQAQWIAVPADWYVDFVSQADQHPLLASESFIENGELRYAGHITCRNGQMVHLMAGMHEELIVGANPLVQENTVAFVPHTAARRSGAGLHLRPLFIEDQDSVHLEVISFLAWPLEMTQRVVNPIAAANSEPQEQITIDLPRFLLHESAATTRVPLDQPVIVAAMTAPLEEGPSDEVICLVLRVSVEQPTVPEADE